MIDLIIGFIVGMIIGGTIAVIILLRSASNWINEFFKNLR